MINFGLSDEQLALQNMARSFAEKNIKPAALKYDDSEEFPWSIIHQAHTVGLMNLKVPLKYGGQGLDHMSACMVTEELSRGCAGIANALGVNNLATMPIVMAGTHEQKLKFLKPLCAEPKLAAFGLTESQAGSDVASLQTGARRERGGYVLNGKKCFISNGGVASLYVIFASLDLSKKAKGITAFIVPNNTPGLLVGKKAATMGIRAANVSEIILEDLYVPAENRLGAEGDGFMIAMKVIDSSRPEVGAGAVGIAQAALEAATAYAKERVTFGKPICANQTIQVLLADMAADVEAARLLVLRAAWILDQGKSSTFEGAMAKFRASDVAVKVATDAVQIFGGYGYMRDHPVEKLMRDSKIYQIFEGTNQINRLVTARELLR